jgi:hypothetical protein
MCVISIVSFYVTEWNTVLLQNLLFTYLFLSMLNKIRTYITGFYKIYFNIIIPNTFRFLKLVFFIFFY